MKVLFKARAKFCRRFVEDTYECKERGVGDIIRYCSNERTRKCRVVMRQSEQLLKVCANRPLVDGITIEMKPGTDSVCMWMCEDYSGDMHGTRECFEAKFKAESDYARSLHVGIPCWLSCEANNN
ncbi:unnamed protein product [Anisakis simplex]|uniref:RanBD1 domain-containing protein n=1 Tax=Anisakis simplex TaxID=6269 RepID=A0A0M3JDS9_ANISI|nr:unnamed protein product [Anisakis simplex]